MFPFLFPFLGGLVTRLLRFVSGLLVTEVFWVSLVWFSLNRLRN